MEEGKNHKILNSILFWSFLIFFFATDFAAQTSSLSNRFKSPKVLAKFSFQKGEDHIILPVNYNGKEYSFVLDTGASFTLFDASLKNELGDVKKTEKATTPGDTITVEIFDAPEAFLGPFNLRCCGQVGCADIRKLDTFKNKEVSGIIGMDFLSKHIVQIDFDSGELLFIEPTRKENHEWGQALPIRYRRKGIPQIAGTVFGDISEGFIIDTGGATTGSLERTIFKNLLYKKRLQTLDSSYQTLGGDINVREARIKNLSIGSLEYEDLIFMECKMSTVGLPFLSRHIVTFDFPKKKIYLRKSKSFDMPDEADMSGLGLFRYSNKTIVWSVRRGSPAHKADIRPRDIILKVGNENAEKYELWQIERLLMSEENRMITLTIKRGRDIKDVSFVLRRRI